MAVAGQPALAGLFFAGLVPQIATSAPWVASPSAMPRPMPLLPPPLKFDSGIDLHLHKKKKSRYFRWFFFAGFRAIALLVFVY